MADRKGKARGTKKRKNTTSKKGAKNKGNVYESHISKLIRARFIPYDSVPAKTAYNLVHRTGMSGGRTERGDMVIQPPLLEYFPWFMECRNREEWDWMQVHKNPLKNPIVKWMLDDAVDKCHAHAGVHERQPLLIFTKSYYPDYFACLTTSLENPKALAAKLSWHLIVPLEPGKLVLMGLFEELMAFYPVPPEELFDGLDFV